MATDTGDALVAVGDLDIHSQNDLLRALRRDVANRRVTVVVLRDDHKSRSNVGPGTQTLAEYPGTTRTFG